MLQRRGQVILAVLVLFGAPHRLASAEETTPQSMPFSVYTDAGAPDNHYVASGWMGDYDTLQLDEASTTNPHSGKTCIKITYTGVFNTRDGWAGMYWQHPPNNWGTLPGGYNLTGATKLTFWARGEEGGERLNKFKVGGITGRYADSDSIEILKVVLSKEWQQFTIDLTDADLSFIVGGFAWATDKSAAFPTGMVFYLDDIRFE